MKDSEDNFEYIRLIKLRKQMMNKRQILASLNKIANELDNNELYNEANDITKIMKKIALDMNLGFLESEEDFGDNYITAVRNAREAVQQFVNLLYQKIDNQDELQNLKERPSPAIIIINKADFLAYRSSTVPDSSKTTYKIINSRNPSKVIADDTGKEIIIHRDPMKEKIRGLFLHLMLNLYDSDNDDDYCKFAREFYQYLPKVEIGIGTLGDELQEKLANVLHMVKILNLACSSKDKI